MNTVKIRNVTCYLEELAPLSYQEDYDNSGLITGDAEEAVSGVLITLDCTQQVVDEAITNQCNLIVAHHPILFRGIKTLSGNHYVQQSLVKAIKNNIAIYAIHTNLDNVHDGVSNQLAEQLGLIDTEVLLPKENTLAKLVSFVPQDYVDSVLDALHQAGAGAIGRYKNCSFQVAGTGSFLPTQEAIPHIGAVNSLTKVTEIRIEVLFPLHLQERVMHALYQAHPYEEVAHYITWVENKNQEVGAGIVGRLQKPMKPAAFFALLKQKTKTKCIRHTKKVASNISRIAVCGGSGRSLLAHAVAKKADVYVSADFTYHDFFEANNQLMIADIGHYESEQFVKNYIKKKLAKKFSTFTSVLSKTVINPINYYF